MSSIEPDRPNLPIKGPKNKKKRVDWREVLSEIGIKVFVGLIAALIIGGVSGAWAAYGVRDRQYQRQLQAAPNRYVNELDRLISKAVADGSINARVNARAIVATRNSLAGSLETVAVALDGEINELARQIKQPTVNESVLLRPVTKDDGPASNQELYDTILVLERVWPAKRAQIETQIRKLLAELGLSPFLVEENSNPSRTSGTANQPRNN